jgi:hypothetical protein
MMERDSSMVQILLIGLGAGAAAAFLFASVASGSLLAILLFYLAPLPILIAALGWSHWAGLIAALVAAAGLAATFGAFLFLAFLLGVGLPAWWLGYLALLGRPVATPAGDSVEWYPVGRLVLWTALLSSCVIVAVLFSFGASEDSIRGALRDGFEIILRRQDAPLAIPDLPDVNRQIDALVSAAPPAAAMSVTLVNLISLWLAGRIVNVSGRLPRPWPELSAMVFPAIAPALLAAAIAGLLLSGLIGILSSVLAASLATVYVVLGFAVLHGLTRGMNSQSLVLTGVYIAVAFVWPALLIIALLGLADSILDIRGRIAKKHAPPTIHP